MKSYMKMQSTIRDGFSPRWACLIVMAMAMMLAMACAGPRPQQAAGASAPEAGQVAILTYNIHIGKSVDDKQIDLGRIAKVIQFAAPDVVGLQEVDRFTERSGRADQMAELQALTGMAGAFSKSIDLQGGEYGIGILTTGDILESRPTLHPVGIEAERRSFLMARIRTRGGLTFWAINTHLGLNAEDRAAQIRAILDATAGIEEPVIILGDLNERPVEREDALTATLAAAGFEDGWLGAPEQLDRDLGAATPRPEASQGFTFPAESPDRRIDYVWARRGHGFLPLRATVIHTLASDHVPLLVEYRVGE